MCAFLYNALTVLARNSGLLRQIFSTCTLESKIDFFDSILKNSPLSRNFDQVDRKRLGRAGVI